MDAVHVGGPIEGSSIEERLPEAVEGDVVVLGGAGLRFPEAAEGDVVVLGDAGLSLPEAAEGDAVVLGGAGLEADADGEGLRRGLEGTTAKEVSVVGHLHQTLQFGEDPGVAHLEPQDVGDDGSSRDLEGAAVETGVESCLNQRPPFCEKRVDEQLELDVGAESLSRDVEGTVVERGVPVYLNQSWSFREDVVDEHVELDALDEGLSKDVKRSTATEAVMVGYLNQSSSFCQDRVDGQLGDVGGEGLSLDVEGPTSEQLVLGSHEETLSLVSAERGDDCGGITDITREEGEGGDNFIGSSSFLDQVTDALLQPFDTEDLMGFSSKTTEHLVDSEHLVGKGDESEIDLDICGSVPQLLVDASTEDGNAVLEMSVPLLDARTDDQAVSVDMNSEHFDAKSVSMEEEPEVMVGSATDEGSALVTGIGNNLDGREINVANLRTEEMSVLGNDIEGDVEIPVANESKELSVMVEDPNLLSGSCNDVQEPFLDASIEDEVPPSHGLAEPFVGYLITEGVSLVEGKSSVVGMVRTQQETLMNNETNPLLVSVNKKDDCILENEYNVDVLDELKPVLHSTSVLEEPEVGSPMEMVPEEVNAKPFAADEEYVVVPSVESGMEEDNDFAVNAAHEEGEGAPPEGVLGLVEKGSLVNVVKDDNVEALEYMALENEELRGMAGSVREELEAPIGINKRAGGRKKRGRPPRTQVVKAATRRKDEEDVCFICFDGGNLVVCDRRGCPKVYHPSCVNRDEAFFRSKGRWNCGWHICSSCQKTSNYMCYTCTYSLCKWCIKDSKYVCVRGNKGLCETCLSTVMLIEMNDIENKKEAGVDFDDRNSWEYLFKDYWLDLKGKLSLTLEEVMKARTPRKEINMSVANIDSSDNNMASSDSSSGRHEREASTSKRKNRKRSRGEIYSEKSAIVIAKDASVAEIDDWASDELLEFVAHMSAGEQSVLSQFDVQALLLEYIKQNNLRDPRRKSQIICDARLQNLFGKARVGHFEMLKLLESHFLVKEFSHPITDDSQGGVVDPVSSPTDADGNSDASTKMGADRKKKGRRRDGREPQTNLDDYAAIDVHNINLMYLRRNLMEELIDDAVGFEEKVVGCFVRIRISGAVQKQDMYRLVQVVGIRKAAERYKTGKKMTDIVLEISNLDKIEAITIDIISNQEFTEEECKRLRQSIKCGLIGRLTVGDLQEKARTLQSVRINDWIESEKLRLGHLRDRASEKGRRKELRECVEKLQLLNTPEERVRRLNEVPEIHSDPHMDPDYESADEEHEDKKKENFRSRDSSLGKIDLGPSSKGGSLNSNWTVSRRNKNTNQSEDPSGGSGARKPEFSRDQVKNIGGPAIGDLAPTTLFDPGTSSSVGPPQPVVDETDKIWHYQDPSGKVQGPFSMTQLRKWSTTGYFPSNLRIWKINEKQDDSILLNDALSGKFQKVLPPSSEPQSGSSLAAGLSGNPVWIDNKLGGLSSSNANRHGSGSPAPGNNYETLRSDRVRAGGTSKGTWEHQGRAGGRGNSDKSSNWNSGSHQSGEVAALHPSYEKQQIGNEAFNLPTPTPQQAPTVWSALSNSVSAVQPATACNSSVPAPGVSGNLFFEKGCPSPTPTPTHEHTNQRPADDGGTCAMDNSQAEAPVSGEGLGSFAPNSGFLGLRGNSGSNLTEWSMPSPTPAEKASLVPASLGTTSDLLEAVNSGVSTNDANNPNAVLAAGNASWGALVQGNVNPGWVNPAAQGNTIPNPNPGNMNMAWGMASQGNPVWVAQPQMNPNINPGWFVPPQANPNVNMSWAAMAPGNMNPNTAAVISTQLISAPQGFMGGQPGWVAPVVHGNMNSGSVQNNWGVPGNPGTNHPGGPTGGQGGVGNPSWDPSGGGNPNPNNWNNNNNNRQGESEGGYSGRWDSGGRPLWNRGAPSGGGGGGGGGGAGQRSGVCRFHESGYCKKGSRCNYFHS